MKDTITSVLDLLGMLVLVAAAAVFVAPWTLAGALAVAGIGLLAISLVIDRRARR